MSKVISVTAFTFDELSDKAKENARTWWRSASEGDNFWSECTIDEAVREGEFMGIEFKTRAMKGESLPGEPCVFWSGFWSQGDGACFEGEWRASDVKADKVADGWGDDPATTEIKRIAAEFDRIAKKYPNAYFKVEHRGHYYHEHCTEFSFEVVTDEDGDNQDAPEEELDAAEGALKEVAKDFMRWIYRRLEKDWDYQNADEQVDEEIRINDYLFTEEGNRTVAL